MGSSSDNPMGSIFDEQGEDVALGIDPMPHDPLHGPLRSGFPWEREQPGEGAPHERPRGAESTALPPTEEYFICLVGPCRRYHEWLAEYDAVGATLLTKVHRMCMGYGKARSLDEGTCFACTRYAPPPLSLQGWRRRVISAHRIGVARQRLGGRTKLNWVERAVEAIYERVKGNAPELPRKS
jgi:hypothetical protein